MIKISRSDNFLVGGIFFFGVCVSFFQIFLGVDSVVLGLFICITLLTCMVLKVKSAFTHAGLFFLLSYLMTVGFAAAAKTVMLETIDSRLGSPFLSFLVVFFYMASLALAVMVYEGTLRQRSIFPERMSNVGLGSLAKYTAIIGLAFWVANRIFSIDVRSDEFEKGGGTGAFGAVFPVYYFSVVVSTIKILQRTSGAASFGRDNFVYLIVGVLMALVDGQKMGIGMTYAAYLIACVSYRHHVTRYQVVVLFMSLFLGVAVLVPLIHLVRAELWQLDFADRISFVVSNYANYVEIDSILGLQSALDEVEQSNFFAYFGQNNILLDRFALVQHIDGIISGVERKGYLDSAIAFDALFQFVPKFIYPGKEAFYAGDIITWGLGLRSAGVVGFPTVPAAAQLYATGGLLMVFLGGFVLMLLFLAIMRLVGDRYDRNLFGCYFVMLYIVSGASWGISHFSQKLLLALPVQYFVLLLIYGWGSGKMHASILKVFRRGIWV